MIVGLCGKKGCGKSTVADLIVKNFKFSKASFATPIKDMLMAMGLTEEEIWDSELKEIEIARFGKSPREMLQLLGTEFGRELISPDVWVRALEHRIEGVEKVIIDDVRFPNEARMIRKNGGVVVQVVRAGQAMGMVDTHVSEQGLDAELIDREIKNVSCYETDLELAVNRVMEEIIYYGAVQHPESECISGQ
jgi:energy-coupling factor transporter ATP-binding protein EcfA2